jgi:C1A family cysteine protease
MMNDLKRLLATVISAALLVFFGGLVESPNSARGQDASPAKQAAKDAPAKDEIPPVVKAVVAQSGSRIAFTNFVELALRRRGKLNGVVDAVGAAPLNDVVKNMAPSDVEDAVITLAHELSGTVAPPNLNLEIQRQNSLARQVVGAAPGGKPVVGAAPIVNALTQQVLSSSLPEFDWRDAGWVAQDSGIISLSKDQTLGGTSNCGCCWAFATIGTFEGADALVNRRLINASEQNLLDCAGAFIGATTAVPYNCRGGWWAFDYLIQNGVATEATYPYTAAQGPCQDNIARPYQAVSWKYVLDQDDIPQITQIKSALCQYGPIAATVFASASSFGGYGSDSPPINDGPSGGLFTEPDGSQVSVDHAIVIVGWSTSKNAWAIKNSWPGWGRDGFGYVDYSANNIGYGAALVIPANLTAPQTSGVAPSPAQVAAPRRRRPITVPRLFPPQTPAAGATSASAGSTPTDLSPVTPAKGATPPAPSLKSAPH